MTEPPIPSTATAAADAAASAAATASTLTPTGDRRISGRDRYELPRDVTAADIDELGHVNNVVYLRWVQDVAIAHWTAAAEPAWLQEVAWVAVRHEIDYKAPSVLGDAIIARTWVGTADSHRFERLTEIVRAGDGKLLARARTLWCPINRATGRLTRVADDVRQAFSTGPE